MAKGANKAVDVRGVKAKKKGPAPATKAKLLHPNSRKAGRLQRGVLRVEKLNKMRKQADKKRLKQGERLLWFQEALEPGKETYTYEEVCDLIAEYISRHDDEIDAIRAEAELRGRRAHGLREEKLIQLRLTEETEFKTTGMKIPDLRHPKMVKMLAEWNLELNLIPRFTMAVFKAATLEAPPERLMLRAAGEAPEPKAEADKPHEKAMVLEEVE